ncbi:MAG: hypothetical protein IKD73_00585 [Selenomonadaceae bacterium]|nr:hypothetical protein [Selenomonadaceae bacterium]
MELATIFLIWLAITVIDNLAKRKKRRLPPPENSPDFDIPTIQGDPNFPGEEVPIFIESPRQAEVRTKNLTPPPRPKKISAQEVHEAQEANELDLNLTPANVMQAFVLSEVLDKPKALRRRF